jgi:hypothetical protein
MNIFEIFEANKKSSVAEAWSQKYKRSINCSHPRGFSQKAHCAGKKKHNEDITMEATCPDCGMCQTHGNVMEIKKGQKDSNGVTRCWPGKHAEGTKKGKNGGQVRNCVPNESIDEAANAAQQAAIAIAKKKKAGVAEAGQFSYGAKKPRKGTERDKIAQANKKYQDSRPVIEPDDQMVGNSRVTKNNKGVAEGIGPDMNDPYNQGWFASFNDANPYQTGTPDYDSWAKGQDEKEAQREHYLESALSEFAPGPGRDGDNDDDGGDDYNSGDDKINTTANAIVKLLKSRQPVYFQLPDGGVSRIRKISPPNVSPINQDAAGNIIGTAVFDIVSKSSGGRNYLDHVAIQPDMYGIVPVLGKKIVMQVADQNLPPHLKRMRDTDGGLTDESVENDIPDLEEVGEPVESIMDAERRLAAGDRIFAFHEMDEMPHEIRHVGELVGYTYDQLLAVPQHMSESSEQSVGKKIQAKRDALSRAREQRRASGNRQQGSREIKLQAEIDELSNELTQLKKQHVTEVFAGTSPEQRELTNTRWKAVDLSNRKILYAFWMPKAWGKTEANKIVTKWMQDGGLRGQAVQKIRVLPMDQAVSEHIVKVKGGYELKSKHGNKNLGKYPTRAGAEKRERQVQYFKHAGESVAEQQVAEVVSVAGLNTYQEMPPYKNYKIFVSKRPYNQAGNFLAYSEIGRTEIKAAGKNAPDAVRALQEKIDQMLNATKVEGSAILDFNVKFATDILGNPRQNFFAKIISVGGEPKLVMAGDDMLHFGKELTQLGFKPSSLRIDPDSDRAHALPSISYSKNQISGTGLIANGRYELGNAHQDQDGNTMYDLVYHSTAHTKSDKMRLNKPAFTVGTVRATSEGVAEGEPIQELSNAALDRYKVKAKKSADELTSLGKYRQANDRTMNVMKATGKQIDNTVTNIRKALNRESVDRDMAEDAEIMEHHLQQMRDAGYDIL